MEKEIRMNKVEVGDSIFSKNDMEFYGTVIEITPSYVIVEYADYEGDTVTGRVSKSEFKPGRWDPEEKVWDLPNWSVR
jgi:hypothetical protein